MLHFHRSTKRADIFHKFHASLEEASLTPTRLFSVATDVAPSTHGHKQSFQEHIPTGKPHCQVAENGHCYRDGNIIYELDLS